MQPVRLPKPVTIPQGRTFVWKVGRGVARRDDDGNVLYDNLGRPLSDPVDLTGYSARMQIRETVDSDDTIADLTSATSHLVVDGPAGTVTVTIPADETGLFDFVSAVADIEAYRVVGGEEIVLGIVAFRAVLDREVTR